MNGGYDPLADTPATCKNGEPGCVGPNRFDMIGEHHYYVCQRCTADATGHCTGGKW